MALLFVSPSARGAEPEPQAVNQTPVEPALKAELLTARIKSLMRGVIEKDDEVLGETDITVDPAKTDFEKNVVVLIVHSTLKKVRWKISDPIHLNLTITLTLKSEKQDSGKDAVVEEMLVDGSAEAPSMSEGLKYFTSQTFGLSPPHDGDENSDSHPDVKNAAQIEADSRLNDALNEAKSMQDLHAFHEKLQASLPKESKARHLADVLVESWNEKEKSVDFAMTKTMVIKPNARHPDFKYPTTKIDCDFHFEESKIHIKYIHDSILPEGSTLDADRDDWKTWLLRQQNLKSTDEPFVAMGVSESFKGIRALIAGDHWYESTKN